MSYILGSETNTLNINGLVNNMGYLQGFIDTIDQRTTDVSTRVENVNNTVPDLVLNVANLYDVQLQNMLANVDLYTNREGMVIQSLAQSYTNIVTHNNSSTNFEVYYPYNVTRNKSSGSEMLVMCDVLIETTGSTGAIDLRLVESISNEASNIVNVQSNGNVNNVRTVFLTWQTMGIHSHTGGNDLIFQLSLKNTSTGIVSIRGVKWRVLEVNKP